ncbi:hypothetical protein ES695_08365 [Candidatus Atribacteria bacterium 1244-E10-H5-B2]|nr:MAG: hypothetical protein ES695_08365 [Candidatus Atribacteria bacterium 1244-E10-H5-B2]
MGRFIQDSNSHGSLKNLQVVINEKKKYLDAEISKVIEKQMKIDWKSPLRSDDYAEYRDEDFLEKLGILNKIKYPLSDFWPNYGPQWDALGVSGDEIILVEAKANIPEMVSSGTGAKNPQSIKKIRNSLDEVKKYLGVSDSIDWTGTFYQYVNRIAHLYYLREKNQIKAQLLFIYFINDITVHGPKTKDEWLGAIQTMECYLELSKKHKLRKYIHDIFIDVNDLRYKNATGTVLLGQQFIYFF